MGTIIESSWENQHLMEVNQSLRKQLADSQDSLERLYAIAFEAGRVAEREKILKEISDEKNKND